MGQEMLADVLFDGVLSFGIPYIMTSFFVENIPQAYIALRRVALSRLSELKINNHCSPYLSKNAFFHVRKS